MTENNKTPIKSLIRTLLSPLIPIFLAGSVFLFCFRFFAVDPFDVHESLYRRLAEEMKSAGTWSLRLTFNAQEFPWISPIYPSLLALLSWFFDGEEPVLSSFSSRFLSLVFAFFTVVVVHGSFKRLMEVSTDSPWREGVSHRRTEISPVYFFLMSFVFSFVSVSVSPTVLLLLSAGLYVCCQAVKIFSREVRQPISFIYSLGSVLGLTVLSVLTSAWALLVAGLSSGLFLFARRSIFFKQGEHMGEPAFERGILIDLLSPLCLAVAFSWLSHTTFVFDSAPAHQFPIGGVFDSSILSTPASAFVSLYVMASGLSLIVGWVFVSAWVRQNDFIAGIDKGSFSADKLHWTRVWLLSWLSASVLCCIIPIVSRSLSVTSLLLAALALLASLGGRGRSTSRLAPLQKPVLAVVYGLATSLPVVFFVLAGLILVLSSGTVSLSFLNEQQNAILNAFLKHSEQLSLGFLLTGVFLLLSTLLFRYWFSQVLQRQRWSRFFSLGCARSIAFFQMLACVSLSLIVLPVAEEVLTVSVQQSTLKAKMFLGVGEKLSTAGFLSPTVVSTLREPVNLWMGPTEDVLRDASVSVILLPVWHVETCRKFGFDTAQAVDFFRICLRSYKQTLEGPKK